MQGSIFCTAPFFLINDETNDLVLGPPARILVTPGYQNKLGVPYITYNYELPFDTSIVCCHHDKTLQALNVEITYGA